MQALRLWLIVLFCCAVVVGGCVGEQQYRSLELRNAAQAQRIKELEADKAALELQVQQLRRQLEGTTSLTDVERRNLQDQIAALEEAVRRKNAMIAKLQENLVRGVQLPVELSTLLEDFAKQHDMVTYDADRGIVKFKSDLLFEKGSDQVRPEAVEAVKALCQILNSEQAKDFDVIIAGHTDDIPIGRPATRAKHPTNWHLSAHRAISVLNVMKNNNVDPKRMSVRGFGEYRPVAPNKPNKGGNPQNRRVEIYIVPKGM